ncbi:MAG: hypothetical protein IT256_02295 [Chitinophagaceae bacterium]|nr:hypothetical protein [Chitinophagaceae bacterium]
MNDRIEKIKNYLKENEHDLFLNHALALEYVKINELELALTYFLKNRSYDPNYVGTYYHLGKLQEKLEAMEDAIVTYEQGMKTAKAQADQHAYNELQNALEDLTDL